MARVAMTDRAARAVRRIAGVLCGCALPFAALLSSAAAAEHAFDVRHYAARIEPDIPGRRVAGSVRIDLTITEDGTREIAFDAGALDIAAVTEDGRALAFAKDGKRLRITLGTAAAANERRRIRIDYRGAPAFGLEFHPERDEVYTIFSTSQWMVSVDAPDERATLDLSVVLPHGLEAAGSGRLVSRKPLDAGRDVVRWRLKQAMPAYVYGFSAGRYRMLDTHAGAIRLRSMSVDRTQDEQQRIFADTGDMLRFFGERAGLRYRGDYTQALVADTVGQELVGLSLLSEQYGLKTLEDPTSVALIAHEAAHQWWGNRVTCRSWRHFWLNEGFANFMAAAYLQHRFGDAAYRAQVERWRMRLEALRSGGKDHALVFADWNKPSADDRAVVYQKGAYVLHLLREELGEAAFWRGIRAYTRAFDGRSVETSDFRQAMERASGRDLSVFFARWVEGPSPPPPPA